MSKILQIVKAKPNPAGKDKVFGTPKAEQLLSEWVDVKNVGTESIQFSSMSLTHTEFNNLCRATGNVDTYWKSSGDKFLQPGQVIRIHTGRLSDEHLMNPNDKKGCDWHGYANRGNFVLNNACGDILTVAWRDSYGVMQKDTVSYDPNPPEGAILERKGNKLVVNVYSYR